MMRCPSERWAFLILLLPAMARAADPPEFPAAGVVRGDQMVQILVPGADGMTIYGTHLGPTPGCSATADPNLRETPNPRNPDPASTNLSVYPKELCGTRVLID